MCFKVTGVQHWWMSLFTLILLTFGVIARQDTEPDGSILLPEQKVGEMAFHSGVQQRLTLSHHWQQFLQENGNWSVQWNEATGTPHRAFGKGIPIPGYSVLNDRNIEAAARVFLEEYQGVLGVLPDRLRLTSIRKIHRVWYVSFRQYQQDIPVMFSEVELRIFDNGKVMAFGADFYPEIDLSVQPAISLQSAKDAAIQDLTFNAPGDRVTGTDQLYILPRRQGNTIDFHLVYYITVRTFQPEGNYDTYVDAHDGEIIWRHNRIRYINTRVEVSGDVQPLLPTDPFVEKPLFDLYVNIGGTQFVTDNSGAVETDIQLPLTVSMDLRGPFLNVNRDDGPDASFSTTLNPGDTLFHLFNNFDSHPAERDAFYHGNFIHRFVTTLDTQFTLINYSMPCVVNINNTCNAFWDGTGVNFFLAGNGCPNTGQMPSVVYHEYGHGINDKLYQQAGSPNGMINGATHEGMADVAAAMIEDDYRVGRGFFGPGTFLRSLLNNNRYPDDISGEVHNDGLIIGGAFWDLRVLTSLSTMQTLSHFAKWGTPDDLNTGVAFSEWFVEVLVADDDDGDISNGTPHFTEINQAFNNHGIGSTLFLLLSFTHTQVNDTQDTLNAYPVIFSLDGIAPPESLFVHYSIDNFQSLVDLSATEVTPGTYQADIPAQSAGTIVKYFITAVDPLSNTTLQFPPGSVYSFLVGFNQVLLDDLENDTGWSVGAPDDNATTGIWDRDDPEPTFVGNTLVQSGNDHTLSGTMCFVTDHRAGQTAGSFDVDNGKTTLFSPIYDMSSLSEPVYKYFKWYTNEKGASPGQDFWVVDISNDGGQTWVNVENTNVPTNGWEKVQFLVSDYVTPTSQVQLRFIASDFNPGSLVEALIDDIEILAAGGLTGISEQTNSTLPEQFELAQNFPNPFNPSTTIRYALPTTSRVIITVYNLLGQEVVRLVSGEQLPGWHSVVWDGRNSQGLPVASGIYIYRMAAESSETGAGQLFTRTRKLVLLK